MASLEEMSLPELMQTLKALVDNHDRLMRPPCFDDPRIAEQDRLNSLPESEDDATGTP